MGMHSGLQLAINELALLVADFERRADRERCEKWNKRTEMQRYASGAVSNTYETAAAVVNCKLQELRKIAADEADKPTRLAADYLERENKIAKKYNT